MRHIHEQGAMLTTGIQWPTKLLPSPPVQKRPLDFTFPQSVPPKGHYWHSDVDNLNWFTSSSTLLEGNASILTVPYSITAAQPVASNHILERRCSYTRMTSSLRVCLYPAQQSLLQWSLSSLLFFTPNLTDPYGFTTALPSSLLSDNALVSSANRGTILLSFQHQADLLEGPSILCTSVPRKGPLSSLNDKFLLS